MFNIFHDGHHSPPEGREHVIDCLLGVHKFQDIIFTFCVMVETNNSSSDWIKDKATSNVKTSKNFILPTFFNALSSSFTTIYLIFGLHC